MTSLLASMLVISRLCYLAFAAPLYLKSFVMQPTSIIVHDQESFKSPGFIGEMAMAMATATVTVVEVVTRTDTLSFSGDSSGSSSASASSGVTVTKVVVVTDTITRSSTPGPSGSSSTSVLHQATSTSTEVGTVTSPASSTLCAASGTWSAPARMTDLSSFNLSHFGDSQNLKIVAGIPADASVTPTLALETSTVLLELPAFTSGVNVTSDASPPSLQVPIPIAEENSPRSYKPWSNDTSILQLFYPKGSINPGQKQLPQGGSQFYAQPLNITSARNVSMEYSVFFPRNFDWVLGGKLPGLYGGHTGCSGGVEALDCFSTRLMWRQRGDGELYLYAPRAKQTAALCSDPQSRCNDDYGLSVARGSFKWAAGAWTTVCQTVVLNTPGKQDGVFTLDVDGKRVIARSDVFYRDVVPSRSDSSGGGLDSGKVGGTPSSGTGADKKPGQSGGNRASTGESHLDSGNKSHSGGGLLGLGGILRRESMNGASSAESTFARGVNGADANVLWKVVKVVGSGVNSEFVDGDEVILAEGEGERQRQSVVSVSSVHGTGSTSFPVGFSGLFFSTFFGGHEQRYATPKDQYVWFKDFSMVYND